ncbi:MAG: hypothetical protein JWQ44_2941 [Chthoniobacter sp.]|nr:hypothetical protein [Chthoniobacter sp.]
MSARQTQRFWLVWNPAGRSPTVKHYTRELAETEAGRLAQQYIGQQFFVMKAVAGAVVVDVPVSSIEIFSRDLEVPF